jgi:hypothetical protein
MKPLALLFFGIVSAICACATSPLLVLENRLIASPAEPYSRAPQLARSPGGAVALVWAETAPDSAAQIRLSWFNAQNNSWSAAVTVATGKNIVSNADNTPQAAVSRSGEIAVLWYEAEPASQNAADNAHGSEPSSLAMVSFSKNRGQTWSAPTRLTQESRSQEFASLAALSDERFLAVWLDGRQSEPGAKSDLAHPPSQALYGREIGTASRTTADVLLDGRVCDCCPTGLVSFEDGTALAVYRDRGDDEIRDIASVSYHDNRWSSPVPLSHDGWKIAGCPVNGPALASSGPHVCVAWFSAPTGQPQVLASTSTSAGSPFLMPLRIDDRAALGKTAVAVLGDGTSFVCWIETAGADAVVMLRRIDAQGDRSVPVRLATLTGSAKRGIPRLALLRNAAGGAAELLLAHTTAEAGINHVTTRLLIVQPPEPDRNPCATCPPSVTRGYAMRGRVESVTQKTGEAWVKINRVPGVMKAASVQFRFAAEDGAALVQGAEIFGRIEKRDDVWWLFSVQSVSSPRKSP